MAYEAARLAGGRTKLLVPWIRKAIRAGTDFYNNHVAFLTCARDAVAIAERLARLFNVGQLRSWQSHCRTRVRWNFHSQKKLAILDLPSGTRSAVRRLMTDFYPRE